MERKEATYLGNRNYFTIFQNILKFHKYDCLSYIAYTNSHPVITQFLQPEAKQLLLFRILLASVVRGIYLDFSSNFQPRVHGGWNITKSIYTKSRFYYVVCSPHTAQNFNSIVLGVDGVDRKFGSNSWSMFLVSSFTNLALTGCDAKIHCSCEVEKPQ